MAEIPEAREFSRAETLGKGSNSVGPETFGRDEPGRAGGVREGRDFSRAGSSPKSRRI